MNAAPLRGSRLGFLALTVGLFVVGGAPTGGATTASDHCLSRVNVTPVEGRPGWVRMAKGDVTRELRFAPPARHQGVPDVTIFGLADTWNADNNTGTIRDTITVVPGTSVRWQWVSGFHTITDGTDSGNCCQLFDYVLDQNNPIFDTTLTTLGQLDYFCFVHEGVMHGVIKIAGPASVPGDRMAATARFSRPPSPNPSRGTVSCAVTLAVRERATLSVVDAAGREVIQFHRGELPAGEHSFRWDGRLSDGKTAPAGVYWMRLWVPGREDTRRFSLIR